MDKRKREQTAYAPYWYVDTVTDSIIQVKNHRPFELIVAPQLTFHSGYKAELDPVSIQPFATESISLRDSLLIHPGDGLRQGRWGDGSRPQSLVGTVSLTTISPSTANSTDFNAWVFTQNEAEGLGFVTVFYIPPDERLNILEGLWWLPYPDTNAIFAIQNASPSVVHCDIDIISGSDRIDRTQVQLDEYGSTLITLSEIAKISNREQGGIRVTWEPVGGNDGPYALFGRGFLIQEQAGFSSPVTIWPRSSGTYNQETQLQHPVAYFGRLDHFIPGSSAYLHPHLLLQNMSQREAIIRLTLDGDDTAGQPMTVSLEEVILPSGSNTHLDLEEQRQSTFGKLVDGVAGMRLEYDGAPGIIAELINVDETGDVVLVRPLPQHPR